MVNSRVVHLLSCSLRVAMVPVVSPAPRERDRMRGRAVFIIHLTRTHAHELSQFSR